ncbi:hypothetical protein BE17_29585 [Sorangium cellulosum]|uniref:Uncharacterized protein n=1 Tax=Sorangium cellulosum TaxID=56 RepID=A0A150RYV9_SORCE|nr:hypothetical protein BE17_29585 [Sorangium cellulosum]
MFPCIPALRRGAPLDSRARSRRARVVVLERRPPIPGGEQAALASFARGLVIDSVPAPRPLSAGRTSRGQH